MPAKKEKKPAINKPSLSDELRALDTKNRNFRRDLDEDVQKKISGYLLMRYSASVEGSADLQRYCLIAANENANKHLFELTKHPELQWLMCTTVSPGLGSLRHYWLGANKKSEEEKEQNSLRKRIVELYPNWKSDEIDLLMKINTAEEIMDWIREHGVEI